MSNHSAKNQQSELAERADKIQELRVEAKRLRKLHSDIELIKLISLIALELESNIAMLDIVGSTNQHLENYRLSRED
jgi:hypothetical protein